MRRIYFSGLTLVLLIIFDACHFQKERSASLYQPWVDLDELFHEVQMNQVFPDSKTFVDANPKIAPQQILEAYRESRSDPNFDLKQFINYHFDVPPSKVSPNEIEKAPREIEEHINQLWEELTRIPAEDDALSTLLHLPNEYIVPGGRFREIYYWDSYFTMIGLARSGRFDLIENMINNFAALIDSVGFVPNGNRTYYLGRSQPPFLSLMVCLLADEKGSLVYEQYLPQLRKEYDFWMDGHEKLSAKNVAIKRVVQLPSGEILNRYWDDFDTPRPESYREDVELASGLSDKDKKLLFRNLRAGAESGWDYSTRWFKDVNDFSTIRTTEILPVDLNCLIYHLEETLARSYHIVGDADSEAVFKQKAAQRAQSINEYFWDAEIHAYSDFVWTDLENIDLLSAASMYPLFFQVADTSKVKFQCATFENKLLAPGGVLTTEHVSVQQWDAPNGWAPLQWISVQALKNYDRDALAQQIAVRWLKLNDKVFRNTGRMMEKYNVMDTTLLAGGGEYPTQDGFGWTNGVYLGLIAE